LLVLPEALPLAMQMVATAESVQPVATRKAATFFEVFAAAGDGNRVLLDRLIREGADSYGVTPDGCTLLMVASREGHLEVVKYLTQTCGLEADVTDIFGNTALSMACACGRLKVARYLIKECHADVHWEPMHGLPALHAAAHNGHIDLVERLVKTDKVDSEWTNRDGETPMMLYNKRKDLEEQVWKLSMELGEKYEM
jgi:ankyrin repeat protein